MLTEAEQRKKHYASLNINKQALDWSDRYYRDVFLRNHGAQIKDGKYSASTMSMKQLAGAARAIRTLAEENVNNWRNGLIAKISAIWCAMADAGVIQNRSRRSMEGFCARYTKASSIQWADKHELMRAIEVLKKWAQREKVKLDG